MSEIVVIPEIQAPNHVTLEYDVEVPFVTLVTQADWAEDDPTKKAFIKNKPDLKTVATTGNYNDLINTPTIPVVPTNVSSFTNDAGYITNNVNDLTNYTKTTDLAAVANSGDYDDLLNKPTIPAAQIQSDWTQSDNTKKDFIKNKPNLSTVATTGSYTDLTDKPTKLSDFTNDEGFIDNTINNLTNYYTKSDTYTKSEVNNLIHNIIALDIEVVSVLPVSDISTTTIYLVPNTTQTTGNVYDEYIYVNNAWELIGSTQVDLSNYYTKTEVDTALSGKQDTIDSSHKLPASNVSGLANVATSGSYNDLSNKPDFVASSTNATLAEGYIKSMPCNIVRAHTRTLLKTYTYTTSYMNQSMIDSDSVTQLNVNKRYYVEFSNGEYSYCEFVGSNRMNILTKSFSVTISIYSNRQLFLMIYSRLVGQFSFDLYELTLNGASTESDPKEFLTVNKLPDYFLNDTIARTSDLSAVATSGSYSDLINTPIIPAAQIQSDWSQSDNTKLDFIKNKPSIPTVYDGVTTLQLNGTQIDTFSANQSGNNTINIEAVPTFPTTSNLTTLVAGKLNTLGSVDYATIALPANPGTAEYNGSFTSTTSGDITVSLPLTYWQGDTDIVAGKTYSFSIQNGVGFIIQLD